ncbi:MAG: winged helix-turn-helix transcriptional regulator [Planctomycetes bacterium]|nr:winged helix-turn-helix transcriptional regulator [Planctomycetota bacterium]
MADMAQKKLCRMKSRIVRAMASPVRLAVIELLRSGPMCVCDIAVKVGAGRSNVSRHLAVLLSAGLVNQRKNGLKVIYSLAVPCVATFLRCLDEVLRHNARQMNDILDHL